MMDFCSAPQLKKRLFYKKKIISSIHLGKTREHAEHSRELGLASGSESISYGLKLLSDGRIGSVESRGDGFAPAEVFTTGGS
jgi:hypothetical protein